ncbi:hypothetical protein [Streptomyces sp. NPDC002692]
MAERLPETGMREKAAAWHEQRYIPPDPPRGVPGLDEIWKQKAADAWQAIVDAARQAVTSVDNISGRTPVVLGDEGTLEERAEEFRRCVHGRQPVVAVSSSGSMRRWVSVKDTDAMSVSIYTHLPEQRPLHTALVTSTAALLYDASGAWRIPRTGEALAITGEPIQPDRDPQFALFPHTMQEHAVRLRNHVAAPMFPYDTSAGIARAMLDGAAPAAIYVAEHVLTSAIVPVAISHGLIGRLQKTNTLMEKPDQATEYLFQVLMGETEFSADWVIAHEIWHEKSLRRALNRTLHPDDEDPYDDDLDEYDRYSFDDGDL